MRHSAIVACTLSILSVLSSACSDSCGRHKPHVPFEKDDATAPALDASRSAMPDAASTMLPSATEWEFAGRKVSAPPENVFLQVLSDDFDGDGFVDVFAVAKRVSDLGPGGVWFYRGGLGALTDPKLLLPAPELTTDPTCSPKPRLERAGAHSVSAELALECAGHDAVGAKRVLALFVVDSRGARLHGSLTFQPPPYLNLSIGADGSDKDGDGVDDVAFTFSLEGREGLEGTPGKAMARLSWFDRATGLSRNVEEPEASFRELTKRAAVVADSPKEARRVHAQVDEMHALARLLCADAGGPAVHLVGLELPACAASRALRDAALLDVKAFSAMKDPLNALRAFDVAASSKEPPSPNALRDAERAIQKLAPPLLATRVAVVDGVNIPSRAKTAEWGALSFVTGTTFLVRGATDATEVDAHSGKIVGSSSQNWGARVVSPDGAFRLVEVYNPCDGGPFHATFAPERDGDPRDVLLPLRTPLQPCKRGEGERPRVVPLAWNAKGLSLLVRGVPLRIADGEGGPVSAIDLFDAIELPRGAPRSPDGKMSAVTSSLGVLVGNAKKKRLLRFPEIEPLALSDCAPNNDASLVVCARGDRVVIGESAPLP